MGEKRFAYVIWLFDTKSLFDITKSKKMSPLFLYNKSIGSMIGNMVRQTVNGKTIVHPINGFADKGDSIHISPNKIPSGSLGKFIAVGACDIADIRTNKNFADGKWKWSGIEITNKTDNLASTPKIKISREILSQKVMLDIGKSKKLGFKIDYSGPDLSDENFIGLNFYLKKDNQTYAAMISTPEKRLIRSKFDFKIQIGRGGFGDSFFGPHKIYFENQLDRLHITKAPFPKIAIVELVVSKEAMEEYGLNIGDEVWLVAEARHAELQPVTQAYQVMLGNPDDYDNPNKTQEVSDGKSSDDSKVAAEPVKDKAKNVIFAEKKVNHLIIEYPMELEGKSDKVIYLSPIIISSSNKKMDINIVGDTETIGGITYQKATLKGNKKAKIKFVLAPVNTIVPGKYSFVMLLYDPSSKKVSRFSHTLEVKMTKDEVRIVYKTLETLSRLNKNLPESLDNMDDKKLAKLNGELFYCYRYLQSNIPKIVETVDDAHKSQLRAVLNNRYADCKVIIDLLKAKKLDELNPKVASLKGQLKMDYALIKNLYK